MEKAVESIAVIAEFWIAAVQHNESCGHKQEEMGPAAHFGPKWKDRLIAQVEP